MKTNKETKAPEVEVTPVEVEENASEAVQVVEVAEEPAKKVIAPFIKNILKGYPDEEYLYVDSKGGVFTTDTPAEHREDAVLYKNPYFENL